MQIHEFPEVQIVGNDAKVRIGQTYHHLGDYNETGEFSWSAYGAAQRAALLGEPPVEYDDAAAPAFYASLPVYPETAEVEARDTSVDEGLDLEEVPQVDESPAEELNLDPDLAAAKERNAARLKKQKAKAK